MQQPAWKIRTARLLVPVLPVLVLLALVFSGVPARGQAMEGEENGAPAATTERARPKLGAGIEQEEPEIFYLPDENGKLLHVPDLNLELYQRLYNQYRGLTAPDPPRYILQQLDVTGKVAGDHAVLTVEYQIQTTEQAKSDTWIRVPLRFDDCVLRGPGKYVGSGEHFLEYRADGDGYVCWLRTEKKTDHRLTLTLAAPLRMASDTTTLRFVARDVPTHLQLQVPDKRIEAEVTRQSVNILRPPQEQGESTSLVLDGLGGEVELSWRPAPEQPLVSAPRLDVAGEIRVTVEGIGQLSCEAQLRIRGFGGTVDSFRVRLPPRMHLVPLEQPGYRVLVAPESPAGPEKQGAEGSGQVLEVRLNSPTTNEVNVRLLFERIPDQRGEAPLADPPEPPSQTDEAPSRKEAPSRNEPPSRKEAPSRKEDPLRNEGNLPRELGSLWQEVGAVHVEGAIRQRGHFDFVVEGEYALDWETGEGVTRRDDIPEAARQQNVVARFEYFRQPCSLKVQVRRKQKRILVEPSYNMTVGGGRIELDAAFRYRVRGDAAFRLRTDFSQWIVDSVERGGVATAENVDIGQVAPLEVPVIVDSTELAEGFLVRVKAHREYSSETKQLTIPLPRPLQTEPLPASILVGSAENVELTFTNLERQGLVIDSRELSNGQVHRFRERSPEAVTSVIAELRVLPRLVSVRGNHTIGLQAATASVEQRLEYRIAYEPLTRLLLRVDPQVLPAADGGNPSEFSVSLDGRELAFRRLESAATAHGSSRGSRNQAPGSPAEQPADSADVDDRSDPAAQPPGAAQSGPSGRERPPRGEPSLQESPLAEDPLAEDPFEASPFEEDFFDGDLFQEDPGGTNPVEKKEGAAPAGAVERASATELSPEGAAGEPDGSEEVERERTGSIPKETNERGDIERGDIERGDIERGDIERGDIERGDGSGRASSSEDSSASGDSPASPASAANPQEPESQSDASGETGGTRATGRSASQAETKTAGERTAEVEGRPAERSGRNGRSVGVLIEVVLPEPVLGRCPIQVRYRVEQPQGSDPGEAQSLRIPLVVPAADDVTRWEPSQLVVRYPTSMDLSVSGQGWEAPATAGGPATNTGLLQLEGSTSQPELLLSARASRRSLPSEIRVEDAWLQAVMTHHQRMDRFSFRVADAGSSVQLELPAGARAGSLRVAVDREVEPLVLLDNSNRVTIALPETPPAGEHVVELWYWFDARPEINRSFAIEAPRIRGVERMERMYWQVVVPRHQHLVAPPNNASAEQTWGWNGFYWGRQANLSQKELESWIGGLVHDPPPRATNQYLFVTLGESGPLRMFMASRLVLLLSASGLVLLIGLVVIYFPALQHPAMYLVLAIALAILAFWTPEVSLLLAQAAGLGLLLFLLSRLINWALGGRRRPTAGLRGLGGPDSKSAEVTLVKPESGASTASVGLAYQLPETDAR